jgi:metallo-beta-lactamase family protein
MHPPSPLPETDYLVIESTYGDRSHPLEDPRKTLKDLISRTVQRGGIVLIPSFAVGRAQEILYLIHQLKKKKEIPDIPVYLNSPMSVQATKIYCDFHEEHRMSSQDCDAICNMAHFVTTVEESKRLNTKTDSCVIISASGMATGGRVLHHLKFLASNPKNLILFVGFQAAGTRGEAMVHGADRVKIHGEMVPVRADVASLDSLSAHADANEMIAWLRKMNHPPKMTLITHGEPLASEAFRKRIEGELKWPSKVPDYLETLDL